jgi:hypothetical protein
MVSLLVAYMVVQGQHTTHSNDRHSDKSTNSKAHQPKAKTAKGGKGRDKSARKISGRGGASATECGASVWSRQVCKKKNDVRLLKQ